MEKENSIDSPLGYRLVDTCDREVFHMSAESVDVGGKKFMVADAGAASGVGGVGDRSNHLSVQGIKNPLPAAFNLEFVPSVRGDRQWIAFSEIGEHS